VVPAIEALYAAYKDKVDFFLVYVREAHPVDARPGQEGRPGNPSRGDPDIRQARSIDDRTVAATQCVANMRFSLPLLLDNMEGTTEKAYGGWPAATAIVDVDGKICFQSHGPGGARPKEAEAVLKQLLANGGKFAGAPAAAEKQTPPAQQPAPPAKSPI
jgi:type I thyroxine 5'-deiodinase